ncbi:HNH endonuclease domain containing protein [Elaphomyces granulatus]
MFQSKSGYRNVLFSDARYPDDLLGGLRLNPSVTQANFLHMLEILIISSSPYDVSLRGTSTTLTRCNEPLQPGTYDIKLQSAQGELRITDEPCITRVLSHTVSGRDDAFRKAVRQRDRKCVISGISNSARKRSLDEWAPFQAAHIFPLAAESCFIHNNFSRWITNKAPAGDSGINSAQNGILLRSDIHQLFDQYLISINSDDGYKIICFDVDDVFGVDGKQLDPICRNPADTRSVQDELLRWHFRQAVLTNMRGAGEPVFELDFTGGDMMGEIRNGPKAAERMEFELLSRLVGYSRPEENVTPVEA